MDYSCTVPGIRIRVSEAGSLLRYERECNGSRVDRYLGKTFSALHIYPVEPVNLPETLTRYLELSFPPIVLPPGAEQTIYVKFPVEIGVFLESGTKQSPFDVFSLVPVKFSLYGLPSSGVITRLYKSDVFTEIPQVDPCREGVMPCPGGRDGTEGALRPVHALDPLRAPEQKREFIQRESFSCVRPDAVPVFDGSPEIDRRYREI